MLYRPVMKYTLPNSEKIHDIDGNADLEAVLLVG